MTLTHRLLRRLGYDTTKEVECTHPVYEYEIEHIDDSVSTEYADEHVHDGAFLVLKEIPGVLYLNDPMIGLTVPWNYHSWDTVGRYDSIREYDREKVGETEWTWIIDKADGSALDKQRETTTGVEL